MHQYEYYNLESNEIKRHSYEEIEATIDMFDCLNCSVDLDKKDVYKYIESKLKK